MNLLGRLLSPAVDLRDPDPERARVARQMLDAYLHEVSQPVDVRDAPVMFGASPADYPSGRVVLDAEPAQQVAFIRVTLEWSLERAGQATRHNAFFGSGILSTLSSIWLVGGLMGQLQRRRQPYTEQDIRWILRCLAMSGANAELFQSMHVNLFTLLRGVQLATEGRELSAESWSLLDRLRENLADGKRTSEGRKTLALIDTMLGRENPSQPLIDAGDDWGKLASALLSEMDVEERPVWTDLLRFAASASGSKPSKTWLRQAREQLDQFGEERFIAHASDWLHLLGHPTSNGIYRRPDGYAYPTALVAEQNADVLKGIVWACSLIDDERLARMVGDAGLACFKKIPGVGARSTKVGNACIWTLGALPGLSGVAELQRLTQKIKLPSARKQIDAALATAAARNGLTRADLDDLAVSDFGLRDGVIRRDLGPFTAEIVIERLDGAALHWRQADGRTQASLPAEVKREFPVALKEVQQTLKDLRAALPVQRLRLEQLLLAERTWPLERWRECYLNHPLLAHLVRRLIWTFERDGHRAEGIWQDGVVTSHDDAPLDWLDAETTVRLWHPIASGAETVLAWRRWLEGHEVTQPFKQAHREVYILTDAERETATYSNRFAAHILRQHQLGALCQQRGWQYRLQGGWDGGNVPQIDLRDWDLRAEFWVDISDAADAAMSGHGVYLYVATDQVRFTRRGRWQPLPLVEVPPLVFSEVMRDVDLFVGVCSVGADPTWLDGGADGRHVAWNDYWREFAFGELSVSAATRYAVLERLLPRLKIADRCRLDDRFLIVRGDLRTYRIHLGSGNILMEPNDQYLCIVPGRGLDGTVGGQLFLPFDGDSTLSVILSKAFLLADDRSIKDPTITRQILAPGS